MKNSFYFQHDSNSRNDENILELRVKFGAEGYGIFWMLLESMSETVDSELHFEKMGGLSLGYGIPKDKLKEIVDFCVSIGLFFSTDKTYWSERMKDHLGKRKVLSEAGKRGAKKKWDKVRSQSGTDSLPIGVAYAKGKERKGKERKENTKSELEIISIIKDKWKLPKLDGTEEDNIRDCEDWLFELQKYIDDERMIQDSLTLAKIIINRALNDNALARGVTRVSDLKNIWVSLMKIDVSLEKGVGVKSLNSYLNSCEFEEFWEMYPKKTAKTIALAKWNEVAKNPEEILEKFKEAFKWQEKDPSCFGTKPQYQPKPQDYILGERWNDTPPKQEKRNPRSMG
jgi:hypothetical protein